jgi:hypothetical protein
LPPFPSSSSFLPFFFPFLFCTHTHKTRKLQLPYLQSARAQPAPRQPNATPHTVAADLQSNPFNWATKSVKTATRIQNQHH